MDKVGLLNRISGLSRYFCAGQSLREPGMDRGQKLACVKKAGFCTSDAVDMQLLVHRRLLVGAGWRWLATVSGVRTGGLSVDVGAVSMLRSFFLKALFRTICKGVAGAGSAVRKLCSLFT